MPKPLINDSDVSIILCGPVERVSQHFKGTHYTASTLRQLLPNSELILVTWIGQDICPPKSLYDKILILPDPGPTELVKMSGFIQKINYRRLVYSAYEGAKAANRKWLWRVRCDCIVRNLNVLHEYSCQLKSFRANKWTFFSLPVLIPDYYSRNPRKSQYAAHPSDLMHFGKTSDLRMIFEAAVNSRFYYQRLESRLMNKSSKTSVGSSFVPEQMIWMSLLQKVYPTHPWRRLHNRSVLFNPCLLANCERAMLGNFLMASFDRLGIEFKKNFRAISLGDDCYRDIEFSGLRERERSNSFSYFIEIAAYSLWTHYSHLAVFAWRRIQPFLGNAVAMRR